MQQSSSFYSSHPVTDCQRSPPCRNHTHHACSAQHCPVRCKGCLAHDAEALWQPHTAQPLPQNIKGTTYDQPCVLFTRPLKLKLKLCLHGHVACITQHCQHTDCQPALKLSLTLKALPAAYPWQLDPASPGTQSPGCQQHQLQGPAVQTVKPDNWLAAPQMTAKSLAQEWHGGRHHTCATSVASKWPGEFARAPISCVEPIRKARLAATICTTAEVLTQLTTSHAGTKMHTRLLLTRVPNKTTRSDLQLYIQGASAFAETLGIFCCVLPERRLSLAAHVELPLICPLVGLWHVWPAAGSQP